MSKVFGMHAVELKPGVDEREFEDFICNQLIPVYRVVPGQTIHLLKGDRGERNGKYMVLIELESQARRDHIYPAEGGIADDVVQLVGDADPIFEKLATYVESFPDDTVTDYVIVSD